MGDHLRPSRAAGVQQIGVDVVGLWHAVEDVLDVAGAGSVLHHPDGDVQGHTGAVRPRHGNHGVTHRCMPTSCAVARAVIAE